MVLVGFRRSKTKGKKYDAIVKRESGELSYIPFGQLGYEQYRDRTGEGLYTKLDHYDKRRREAYRKRHSGEQKVKYSPGYFAWYYLW
jgi:hypothetical protein